MPTTAEQVLEALTAAVAGAAPPGTPVARNATLPERVPAEGLLIVRDGQPGQPLELISPPAWIYQHRAEVDVIVDGASAADPEARFDALKESIGLALAADRTLGGLCDWAIGEAPAPVDLAVEGAAGLKAASVGVILEYVVADPLAG